CPTGAIDNWRSVLKADAYSIDEQYTWDVLPEQGTMALPSSTETPAQESAASSDIPSEAQGIDVDTVRGAVVPPWSAARPYVNL
ncbi:benzoyl-CoA oxygenase, partial [Burkholderia sp. SIMBA_048]